MQNNLYICGQKNECFLEICYNLRLYEICYFVDVRILYICSLC